jgi:hypothetical protein
MPFSDTGINRQILWSPGPQAPNVTLAGTVTRGDILGHSTGWKAALATAGSVIQGRLVALADGVSGDVIPAAHIAVVGGYSGATPGNPVYVDEGSNNGMVTQTIPTHQGDATTVIGIALSATEILFFLNSRADSVAA